MHLSPSGTQPSSSVTPTAGADLSLNCWSAPTPSVTIGCTATTLASQPSVDCPPSSFQDALKVIESTVARDSLSLASTLGTKIEEIPINDRYDGMESLFTEPNSMQEGSHEQNEDVADETTLDPGMSKEMITEELTGAILKKLAELLAEAGKLSPERRVQVRENLDNDLKIHLKGEEESVQELGGLDAIADAILPREPQGSDTGVCPSADTIQKIVEQALERAFSKDDANKKKKAAAKNKKTLTIAGGVIGGIVAVLLSLCLLHCYWGDLMACIGGCLEGIIVCIENAVASARRLLCV